LEELVKKSNPSIGFHINAEKPRRGVFRVATGGEEIILLEDLKRPFTQLRDLDLTDIADRIVSHVKE
jgi:hypothetical protein